MIEDFYTKEMNRQDIKIKTSYALKALILLLVVIVQVYIFLRLVDRKLGEIKDIIAGPN